MTAQARVIPIASVESWSAQICGRCVDPGHCCKRFYLTLETGFAPVYWDDGDRPVSDLHPTFEPIERIGQWTALDGPDVGRTYSAWAWRCTALAADGRCSIYESRPALCRSYQPLDDFLCAMKPTEGAQRGNG